MDWKEKLKWKLLVILIALIGILIVWCAGEAGEEKRNVQEEILTEYVIKENEKAEILSEGKEQPAKQEETGVQECAAKQEETEVQECAAKQGLTEEQEYAEGEPLEEADPHGKGQDIRVLLMTDGYESYYHEYISVQFQGDYEIQGSINRTALSGEILELQPGSRELEEGQVTLLPREERNRLVLLSLNRGQGSPAYQGKLKIYRDENGLRMVNELPLETYLCGVVPSEMPASYHMEALKAQAVCARTYAWVQMHGSKLESLGAQVDDSVSFQVYQNSPEDQASSDAVMATAGQVLLNEGEPIHAYYFSTSHGKTSTDEVWEAAAPSSYLKSVVCDYDASRPWYQWSVFFSEEKLQQNVQKMFPEVNRLEYLEIREKGEGDAVLNLAVYTDKGEKEIHSEYEIRSLLSPSGLGITRQDGSVVRGSSLLPSAYFTLEEQKDKKGTLAGYRVLGGGYGHGVGMSQNGAEGMADAGKNYEEILFYFYKDVEVGNINNLVKSGDS